MLHNVNNNQVYRLNSGSSSLCSKPRRKFVQTSYALKSQLIGLIFVADSKVKARPCSFNNNNNIYLPNSENTMMEGQQGYEKHFSHA